MSDTASFTTDFGATSNGIPVARAVSGSPFRRTKSSFSTTAVISRTFSCCSQTRAQ